MRAYDPCPPGEAHPAYAQVAESLRRLLNQPRAVLVPIADPNATSRPSPPTFTMTRRTAYGLAPYVGRPFVYAWDLFEDELGRMVAGDSRIEYTDPWPWPQ